MDGVAMARNGLIFGKDGATGPGKVSRYLRGLRDAIQNNKKWQQKSNIQTSYIPRTLVRDSDSVSGMCVCMCMCVDSYVFSVLWCVSTWDPVALELRIARTPMAPELRIALKMLVLGNYQILRFVTHSRALNFLASPYCREFRCGTFSFA